MEPVSVAEKAIRQAWEIQRRLKVWRPRKAAILGTGPLGLLASMILKLRGLEVTAFGQKAAPYLNSELLEEIGVRYLSTQAKSLREGAAEFGPFDFILEGTGYSPLVYEAMDVLGKNGILAMVSVTGGERRVEVPADRINQGFVLGNKVAFGSVNASREDFEQGVADLSQAELMHPGWLEKLLTHRVRGLENYRELSLRRRNRPRTARSTYRRRRLIWPETTSSGLGRRRPHERFLGPVSCQRCNRRRPRGIVRLWPKVPERRS
jgi:threonine dehydrogenase-like Zn-dependent dehydrogenase